MSLPTVITHIFLGVLLSAALMLPIQAQEKEEAKLEEVEEVLRAMMEQPDEGIPITLLHKAEAIVVVPKLKKGGFVVGGKFGRGVAMVRQDAGNWSDPLFIKIAGGSFGLQIGYSSTDLFLIFKDARSLERLAQNKGEFTIGGDLSIAAGPVGRQSSANTDLDFEAEVYSYSRSRGIFAGVSLEGSEIRVDEEANDAYYGTSYPVAQMFEKSIQAASDSSVTERIKAILP